CGCPAPKNAAIVVSLVSRMCNAPIHRARARGHCGTLPRIDLSSPAHGQMARRSSGRTGGVTALRHMGEGGCNVQNRHLWSVVTAWWVWRLNERDLFEGAFLRL